MGDAADIERAGFGRAPRLRGSHPPALIAASVTLVGVLMCGGIVTHLVEGWRGDAMMLVALMLNVALIVASRGHWQEGFRATGERFAIEDRQRALLSRDPLTGFVDRRQLIAEAGSILAAPHRVGGEVAVILVDLDRFQTVNQLHGTAGGDRVLEQVALVLQDVLPASGIFARLAGDEFAVAFPFERAHGGAVGSLSNRLVARLAAAIDLPGGSITISASIGIARTDERRPDIETLIRRAGIAMRASKRAGGDRATWFEPAMEEALALRGVLESELRRGIPAGQIVPYYEQQIDLASGALIGFEVLARWQHPTRGLVQPDSFIPVAEETGLISELSLSIMRQAFEQARGWDAALTLSVNISPAQLRDPWLAQKIVRLLVGTGFPPSRLEIEITESSLFENLALAQTIVGSLKNQGVRLALDDFGTGYSSLAHLRALPFDRIKIDKSFVTTMHEDGESAAIVDLIAKLGQSLGLPVTAEGVENEVIEARLRALGCHKGQGYHFGRPLSGAAVERMLAERSLLTVGRAAPAARIAG